MREQRSLRIHRVAAATSPLLRERNGRGNRRSDPWFRDRWVGPVCGELLISRKSAIRHTHAFFGLFAAFAAACTPLYTSDSYINSTSKAQDLYISRLSSESVAVLGVIAPANLQGLGPSVSLALVDALTKAQPPVRAIPVYEAVSIINEHGLAQKYVDLISDFGSRGILELQLLRPIGSELGSHYLLLPGLAEFDQTIMDKYDLLGVKLVRTRVTTLRLWLQLWDTQTGRILWESAGELTAATALLSAKRTVPLEKLAQELWLEMIQEDLLEGRTETRLFRRIRE